MTMLLYLEFLREVICLTGIPSYMIASRVLVEPFKVEMHLSIIHHPQISDETEHMKRIFKTLLLIG